MATETAVDVVMPQMGVSVSEGTVTKWLKQEGDHVDADEPLLEISTDKVDTEVPSRGTGDAAPSPAVETPPEPTTQRAADEAMAAADEGVGDRAPSTQQPSEESN